MKESVTLFSTSVLVLMLVCGLVRSDEKTPLDAYGDPLPHGAIARFGTLRWRLPNAIKQVTMSPNGKLVAAVNMDGKVAIWEKESGRLLHEISGSKPGEACVAFSPDGHFLATGERPDYEARNRDYRIRIWDLKTGKLKTQFPPLKDRPFTKLIFTSDGTTLISAGYDQPAAAWKFPSGEKIREFPTDDSEYSGVALSPDEKWLAVSGGEMGTITVFSFDGSRQLFRLASKRKWGHFDSFEFSPDGRSLLTHSGDALRLWEMATGKLRSTIPLKHVILNDARFSDFDEARFSPDGKRIALRSYSRDIHWLDVATGKPLDSWKGCTSEIGAMEFSRDGKSLVTGEWGVVRVWDTATGKVMQQPSGPSDICDDVHFSADGKTVLAANQSALHFLDGETLRERVRMPITVEPDENGNRRLFPVAYSADGNLAAFQETKDAIQLVDARAAMVLRTLRRAGSWSASLAFSPDGKKLYATDRKSAGLRVWDVQTGEEIAPLDKDVIPYSHIALARRAEKLAVAVDGANPRCRFWDLRTGNEDPGFDIRNPRTKHGPDEIALSQDGKLLLASFVHDYVSVWDVAKRVELYKFPFSFEDGPFHWAFNNDSKLLVTSHGPRDDNTLRTWDMSNGNKVAELRTHGHPGGVVALTFSPDGEGLISSCTNCTILRWRKTAWQGK